MTNLQLTELPYAYDALEPFISQRTLEIHHKKHHAGYVSRLQEDIAGDPLENESLKTILLSSTGTRFNLAAQVWNHDFYWKSMTPRVMTIDSSTRLGDMIENSFGDIEHFLAAFKESAANEFGSGWAWLAYNPERDKLEVFSTTDALNPLPSGRVPLITLDVWEHAYYLDYQNKRGDYIDTFLGEHVNWEFAEQALQTHFDETNS